MSRPRPIGHRRSALLGALAAAALAGPYARVAVAERANLARPPVTIEYARPPRVGRVFGGQPDLVRCESAAGARATARTGFYAAGCRAAARAARWVVLRCTRERLEDGGLWMLEVREVDRRGRPLAEDAAPLWVPLPWHDWA